MLTPRQRDDFAEQGYVRIPAAFSRTQAAAMEDRLWTFMAERHGVRREAPETWSAIFGTGLQDLKDDAVFEPIGGPATTGALDDLLGTAGWERPRQWGQFLVTFPAGTGGPDPLTKATWHSDFDLAASPDRLSGVMVFSFLSNVPSHSGGTAVLAGSHRVVQRFVAAQPRHLLEPMKRGRKALLQSDPWLAELAAATGPDWFERQLGGEGTLDGIRVRVEELTGTPGDVVVGHPWLLHAPAPNRATKPRLMRLQRVHAAKRVTAGADRPFGT